MTAPDELRPRLSLSTMLAGSMREQVRGAGVVDGVELEELEKDGEGLLVWLTEGLIDGLILPIVAAKL